MDHTCTFRGQFGFPAERDELPMNCGCNEKGGMTEEELEKYLFNSILPLYPDTKDEPGYYVILKVDSGLGRNFLQLLAKLRVQGF